MKWSFVAILFLNACVTTPQPLREPSKPAWNDPIHGSDEVFERFHPGYRAAAKDIQRELNGMIEKMFAFQREGRDMTCSRQIAVEAEAALDASADTTFARDRLNDLRKSLEDKTSQAWANVQSQDDGSWGACYKQWFWKVVESSERLRELNTRREKPRFPPTFLDRVNSPEKLVAYLDSLLISDTAREGTNKRRELNESGTTLVRMIVRDSPRGFWDPGLKEALVDYLDRKWQNPETGFWGAWFREGDRIIKTDDLSITFHIVSYRRTPTLHMDRIAQTTLAIRDRPYPLGWHDSHGGMSNHHNYDVARLLRMGWDQLGPVDRESARTEMRKMLDWCLRESLQPDGSFRYNHSDDSLGDSYYFGVSLLSELGYFSKAKRFWTDEDFPGADATRQRIIDSVRRITRGAVPDDMLESALGKLEGRE